MPSVSRYEGISFSLPGMGPHSLLQWYDLLSSVSSDATSVPMSVRHAAIMEKTLLFKTLRSALESYKFQFNSMTPCSSFLATQARFPWKLWSSWQHEVNVVSSVTWHLPSRRVRSEIYCQILSSARWIYLRLPLLTLLDMRPRMYSSLEVLRLDLPRCLERLGVGTSLCLRHPGDALDLRLLLLRRRSLFLDAFCAPQEVARSPEGVLRG